MKLLDNSTIAQAAFILHLLENNKSLSTFDFRDHGVVHPAGRIKELRDRGWNIKSHWSIENDSLGRAHRIARYYLNPLNRRPV